MFQYLKEALFSQLQFDLSFYKQLWQWQTKRLPRGRAHVSLEGLMVMLMEEF